MESRFRRRFSRIFQTSFSSCRSKLLSVSDIIEKSLPLPLPRNLRNFRSITTNQKFRTPETAFPSVNGNGAPARRKVSEKFSPFLAAPAPPPPPLKAAPPCEFRNCLFREKKKKKSEKVKERKRKKNKKRMTSAAAAVRIEEENKWTEFGGAWWYSSDDDDTEDETETLFSSRSLTSDSSASRRRRTHRKKRGGRRRFEKGRSSFPLDGKVKGSLAVVKKSRDPYKDFRASMVEMIVEKMIFAEKELEELLECLISLNSRHYHTLIFEAYAEVREALFFSDVGFRI